MASLTMGQKKVLAIIPHVTGLLSLIGSCSILYDIWSDRKEKMNKPYFRIILGLSCADVVTSLSSGLSTWPIPRGTEGIYGAVGTTASCTAQGFFIQLTVLSPIYNLNLSVYYLLLGKYQLTEAEIANRYERYMHAVALVIGFGFAILGLPLSLYNNANLWCWIAAYPASCEDNAGRHGDVPCERGENAWLFRWLIFYGPIWVTIIGVTWIMVMLTKSVRVEEKALIEMQTEIRSQRTSMNQLVNQLDLAIVTDEQPRVSPPIALCESHRYERSRQMFRQAMFYLAVFHATYFFVTVNRMYQLITGESSFTMMVLSVIFGPFQGFLNFIVYRHGQIAA